MNVRSRLGRSTPTWTRGASEDNAAPPLTAAAGGAVRAAGGDRRGDGAAAGGGRMAGISAAATLSPNGGDVDALMAGNGNAAAWFIDRHLAAGRGERLAFVDPVRSLSYAQLGAATAQFAGALAEAGIGLGAAGAALLMLDSVFFPNRVLGLRARRRGAGSHQHAAAARAGRLHPRRRAGRGGGGFFGPDARPAARAARPEAGGGGGAGGGRAGGFRGLPGGRGASGDAGSDGAAPTRRLRSWLYSSGSTGAPKGVRHVHGSLRATAETYGAQVLGIGADDVMFSASKMFHAYGLGNAMTFPMSVGASAVLLPERPTPDAVLAMLRRFRPTLFAAVPTLYAALLASPAVGAGAGSDRLRRCISAGEALPEHVGRGWRERVGVDILDGIGSTEMLHIFVSNRPGAVVRYGTTGRGGAEAMSCGVVDEAGAGRWRTASSGELLVRGAERGRRLLEPAGEKAGKRFVGEWTRTGDTYSREADGHYRYGGRWRRHAEGRRSIWVSPFEVEEALGSGIRRCWRRPWWGMRMQTGFLVKPTRLRGVAGGRRRWRRGRAVRGAEAAREGQNQGAGNIRAGSRASRACRRPRPARSQRYKLRGQ